MPLKRKRQIFVEYRDYVTATSPIQNRTYTMTHSDETGNLFVTVGLKYAEDKTNELQDQVYLKWTQLDGKNLLYGEVLIDDKNITGNAQKRDEIFKREMPLALYAIYVAEQPFFEAHTNLTDTPILINFKSQDPTYNKLYSYGSIGNYSKMTTHKPSI